ncbi:hypothetical protein [Flaviaesturariibacter amylovorans]|uniref:hypothetical protein n=1 Tax=Flaviaesturariibacter amylovorans TaxID=1084520 RepID=UPI0031ED4551
MKQKHKTYWKAFFLLLVFSLNTVVSFACSLGGVFHQLHHQSATSAHQHPTGHSHEHSKGHSHSHKQAHAGGNQHDHSGAHKHDHTSSSKSAAADECCSDAVVKLEKTDKATTTVIKVPAPALEDVFLGSLAFFLQSVQAPKSIFPQHYRWRPPGTIQDLRIAIQSFQI